MLHCLVSREEEDGEEAMTADTMMVLTIHSRLTTALDRPDHLDLQDLSTTVVVLHRHLLKVQATLVVHRRHHVQYRNGGYRHQLGHQVPPEARASVSGSGHWLVGQG